MSAPITFPLSMEAMTVPSMLAQMTAIDEPDWQKIETQKRYIHEAGHAVVARLKGFHVEWVSTDQYFIAGDPLAKEHEANFGDAVCMTLSSPRIQPILDRKAILNKESKGTIIGYCMHVMAGPFAEMFLDPESFNDKYSQRDLLQVMQLLSLAEPNGNKRKKLFEDAKRALKKMLRKEWPTIERLAFELEKRGALMAPEIDAIIASMQTRGGIQ